MARPLPAFKSHALRDDAFLEGHTLCPGCTEAVAFHELGRATDNGRKTMIALGTFCGEVSTLLYPNVISWGRGQKEPAEVEKSVGIIHNVFESAPTLAEAMSDTAQILSEVGAWRGPRPNVLSVSGDGGALSIGLRSLLHSIHRRARITVVVYINEVFANTGFQYSPSSLPFADSSTLPNGGAAEPIDHLGLAVVAGAAFVAQATTGYAPFFAECVEEALHAEGTSVIFVPSPCITGWKFEEGLTAELGRLSSQTGLFPCFRKRRGEPGQIRHVPEKSKRPGVEKFLAGQQRFEHLVRPVDGVPRIVPGREAEVAALQAYADRNVERLERIAQLL
ncbi:MAG TPA: thiamine pyrophosphate-dependent enzyme [Myxococcales bacterium]|nr:thiamine pyrophosphate-dependent enzyme [Myxococcales bacterium]